MCVNPWIREGLGSAANGNMLNIYTSKVFADNRDASLSLIKRAVRLKDPYRTFEVNLLGRISKSEAGKSDGYLTRQ